MFKKIVITLLCIFSVLQAEDIRADVLSVAAKGTSGAYTFAVKLNSTETGCAQYADWWEVLSEEGALLYRRILVHSHPDTQPFTRSGGPVAIKSNETVYVRGHMNKAGYVGVVFRGTVVEGFKKVTKMPTFAKSVEKQMPLPNGCAF